MDKILETLFKLIPFARLFENLGLSKEMSVALSSLTSVIWIVLLTALSKYLINHYKNSKATYDLTPYFDYHKVKASRDLFIPTKFQNESPTREEEPKFTYKFVSKTLLIPFFIKTVFNEKKESAKFYLVLGDSGMGKTTFMINLYLQYNSFLNFSRRYKIRLFPFGDTRILDQIKKIDPREVPNTILLLDAFDEDRKLLPLDIPDSLTDDERFRRRLDEIIETVQDFREVVITSRTQYFPGQENEPYELKIRRYDDKGFHTLAKLYLSPFDDKDIKHYLNKKYGVFRVWNRRKKQIATAIVKNSPKLMVRPMLLSYIDYLTDDKKVYATTYEIYEALIDKWLEREATKRKYSKDREKFKKDLYTYSRLVAVEIYRQRRQTALLCLKKEVAIEIARINQLNLRDYEITGQSLLTRDAERDWKFAHKSIFEFLVAQEATSDIKFWFGQNLNGMDMTEQFLSEKLSIPIPGHFVFVTGDSFLMGSPDDEANRKKDETQHQVKVGDFYMAKYPVTVAQFETFIRESRSEIEGKKTDSNNILNNKEKTAKQHPATNVSWNEAVAYCQWLTEKLNITFRLPTEAEWEYACRASTTTPFYTGDKLTTNQANFDSDLLRKTTPVGSYKPNGWGLYDMHGNVWEWCLDWYGDEYYDECKKRGLIDNPQGPETGSYRVLRGGCWNNYAHSCRSAYRGNYDPSDRNFIIGFRLVFVP